MNEEYKAALTALTDAIDSLSNHIEACPSMSGAEQAAIRHRSELVEHLKKMTAACPVQLPLEQ
jgi:hypothetical protein